MELGLARAWRICATNARMLVETTGRVAAAHLKALRIAARSGHIRRAALLIGRVLPRSPDALVHLDGGATVAVPLDDPYWARILVGWEYEPEVRRTLDAAVAYAPDAVLFDCGANIGYWAARYAARVTVIAVEAVEPTYQRLVKTATHNGFKAVHRAIWDRSGQSLTIRWEAANDPGASLTQGPGSRSGNVTSVTLDDLYQADAAIASRPPIVKLDVEDAELQAIAGAGRMGPRALWVYEDHGKERTHKVTARFFDLGFDVFHVADRAERIVRLAQLDAIKAHRALGYNFVALKADGPWAGLPDLI
jgi:FkbM family methyltransferase